MTLVIRGPYSILSDLPGTFLADIFPPVGNEPLLGRAEDAGGLVFLQDDAVILHEDLQLIPFRDVQGAAKFDRQDDTSQIVHFSNDPRRFHSCQLPSDFSHDSAIVLFFLS